METSHVVAAILMLVSPAVFALGYQLYQPEHAVGRDGSATRRLHISLWSITIACVGLWAGLAAVVSGADPADAVPARGE